MILFENVYVVSDVEEKEENIIGYEAEDDKCCISSPKDSNSRCSSRSACDKLDLFERISPNVCVIRLVKESPIKRRHFP